MFSRIFTKVAVAVCIFRVAGLFLALDSTYQHTYQSLYQWKYHKSVQNAVFINNESLFVSVVATSVFQLNHMLAIEYELANIGKY